MIEGFDTSAFLATGRVSDKKVANEEVIGVFSIAWRCLYAAITESRMESSEIDLDSAIRRAYCMIYNRLRAYGKACKDFCIERKFTGRKCTGAGPNLV